MLVIPRATEKAYTEQTKNTYIFNVPEGGSKQEIAKAVEEQFNVTVEDIRVLTRKGKATRFSKGKHAYPGTTYRRDKKIAYVTLKEGDKIRVFEEEAKEDNKKSEKKGDK
jgi:large subunit ribosomal protein L23